MELWKKLDLSWADFAVKTQWKRLNCQTIFFQLPVASKRRACDKKSYNNHKETVKSLNLFFVQIFFLREQHEYTRSLSMSAM